MRIDGTNGLQGGGLTDGTSRAPKNTHAAGTPEASQGTELRLSQTPYIQAASATDEVDMQAVAAAKELIQSGQLDTPEAAQRAAQNILDLGI